MELEEQEKAVEKGGKGGREKGPPAIEEDAASDDGKEVGDGEITLLSAGEVDQSRDEKVIDDDLEKDKLVQVFHFVEREGVEDGHQIKKADKVVEGIGQRNEKIFLFRDLKEEGDGQKEGQDDEAAQHEAFDTLKPLWIGIVGEGVT